MRSWQVGNPGFSNGVLQGAGLGMRLVMGSGGGTGSFQRGNGTAEGKSALHLKPDPLKWLEMSGIFVSGSL